ncbi:MAG: arylesterase [Candidatus Eremiobacteraeota bacterium]|nr:arylesterase [Candidatus Eremiobacteraeota bacterium]MCW5866648.1 arylesterase [Candidatus Eremiobacteraeota bacterium]
MLGDSLSYGLGAESNHGYICVLQKRLGIEIVNKGVNGDTSKMALDRLQKDVLDLKPALVLVELGGNDFMQKVPLDETFANLDRIITSVQAQQTPVLLIGVQNGLFSNKAAGRYRKLADLRHTGLVANALSDILTRADLKSDAIHPNDKGYERMADEVEPELRRMLRKLGRL